MINLSRLIPGNRLTQPVVCEYWVFGGGPTLPSNERLLDLLRAQGLSAREALLFNDIRFHLGLSLRKKNEAAFDVVLEAAHGEEREVIDAADSFVVVRFVSETPLHGWAHLEFMARAAGGVAHLKNGLIFDRESNRCWGREEWQTIVTKPGALLTVENQVQVHAEVKDDCRWVHSHGMRKFGLPDLELVNVPHEHGAVAHNLLWSVARLAADTGQIPRALDLDFFGHHALSITRVRRKTAPHHRGLVVRFREDQILKSMKEFQDENGPKGGAPATA